MYLCMYVCTFVYAYTLLYLCRVKRPYFFPLIMYVCMAVGAGVRCRGGGDESGRAVEANRAADIVLRGGIHQSGSH